jgi:hypothetical protein
LIIRLIQPAGIINMNAALPAVGTMLAIRTAKTLIAINVIVRNRASR